MLSAWVLAVLPGIISTASAKCECGYTIDDGGRSWTFTDMLESDLVHLDLKQPGLEYGELGWAPQQFNLSKATGRGPFGEIYSVENVRSNVLADKSASAGDGRDGGSAGLQLVVGGNRVDDMVVVSEVATADQHHTFGTYRASIKVTDVAGTCTAFFWVSRLSSEREHLSADMLSATAWCVLMQLHLSTSTILKRLTLSFCHMISIGRKSRTQSTLYSSQKSRPRQDTMRLGRGTFRKFSYLSTPPRTFTSIVSTMFLARSSSMPMVRSSPR